MYLEKGECSWAGLRDSTCPKRPESSTGKINKLDLKVNRELEEGWGWCLCWELHADKAHVSGGWGGQRHTLSFCGWTESKEKSLNPARGPFFSWSSGRHLPSAFIPGQNDLGQRNNTRHTFSIWVLAESILNPYCHAYLLKCVLSDDILRRRRVCLLG